MFSFFKPKSTLAIIYDIGTSSVGAGLVKFEKDQLPQIIYTVREQMHVREKSDARRYLTVISEILKKVNVRIHDEGLAHLKFTVHGSLNVNKHFLMLSSPWSASETKIASFNKKDSFELSESFVKDVLDAEEKLFEKSLSTEKLWTEKPVVIGKEVIQTKINGYEIENPFGKRTREAEIAFVVSVAPKDVIEKIESVLVKSHSHNEFRAFAFPIVVFSVIRDLYPNDSDFIFMDIAGELTDLIIVTNNVPLEHASIPMGRNFIVRSVGKAIHEPPTIAMSTVISILSGSADPATSSEAKEELNKAKLVWLEHLRSVFRDISSRTTVPRKVFVMTHGEFVPLFMQALKTEMTSEWNIDGVSFTVELVNDEKLKERVMFTKTAHKDPFIALATAFIDKMETK